METHRPLRQIAKVVRSKNSGPFEITFDVIFSSGDDFRRVRDSGAVTKALVSELYGVPEDRISVFGFFEQINAIKVTMPRPRAQGSVGETDMHACQQHVPLAEVMVPWGLQAPADRGDRGASPAGRNDGPAGP